MSATAVCGGSLRIGGPRLDALEIAKDVAIFGGGLSGFAALVKLRWDARENLRKAQAAQATTRTDLIKIAQDAAGAVIADLRTEIDRLRGQLDEVEAEFATFRKAHDTMIADKDAELALLRGQVRQLSATVDAYERLLTAHDIPHERPTQIFYEIRGGEVRAVDPSPTP
jgi:septal ring factor EnvC (AmiA/AmiB activator)